MKQNSTAAVQVSFAKTIDYDKVNLLEKKDDKQSFNDRFRQWLNVYTKPAREKIWMDIESYR